VKRLIALAAVALAAALVTATPSAAEPSKVRIPRQPGLTYLAFYVMEHDKLVEKQAGRLGITLEAEYVALGTNTGSIDALLSGAVDVVSVGVPAFLNMWEKSKGNLDIKAVGSYNAIQLALVTRNPRSRRSPTSPTRAASRCPACAPPARRPSCRWPPRRHSATTPSSTP